MTAQLFCIRKILYDGNEPPFHFIGIPIQIIVQCVQIAYTLGYIIDEGVDPNASADCETRGRRDVRNDAKQ